MATKREVDAFLLHAEVVAAAVRRLGGREIPDLVVENTDGGTEDYGLALRGIIAEWVEEVDNLCEDILFGVEQMKLVVESSGRGEPGTTATELTGSEVEEVLRSTHLFTEQEAGAVFNALTFKQTGLCEQSRCTLGALVVACLAHDPVLGNHVDQILAAAAEISGARTKERGEEK